MKKILAYTKLAFVLAVLFSLGLYPLSMVTAQIAPAPEGTVSESEGPTIAPPLTPGPIAPAPDAEAGTVGPDRPDRITPSITPAPDASASEVDEAGNVVPHLPPRVKPSGPATRIDGSAEVDVNHAPVITIHGENPMTIVVGGTFTELAVSAMDDGVDVTSQIVTLTNQAVDTNTIGSYSRVYYVSDAQGLSDTKIRTVNVVADNSDNNGNGNGGGRSGGSRRNGSSSNGQVLGASDFKFLSDLRYGMRNNDVMELQKRLRAEGFFFYPENTGYFGPFTRGAVMLYQYTHYSEIGYITGFFGPLTRAVINR